MGDSQEYNNFKLLRYKDKNAWDPIYTIREMVDMTGLAASTISKIEREDWRSATATTIKAYHDIKDMDISYEYLFGESNTKAKEYSELGKQFPFDDSFYNHLKELLALDEENNHFVEYMLSALIYNPHEMFEALKTIYKTLYKIHSVQNDKSLSTTDKDSIIKMQEYIFNQSTINYLEHTVMPLLVKGFKLYNDQLADESARTQKALDNLEEGVSALLPCKVVDVKKL